MYLRIILSVLLALSGILNGGAAESAAQSVAQSTAQPASAASSAEQVKRVCRQVWKHDHYEEKCRTIRRGPPPAPRIDQPPSPPNSRKDGPQSRAPRHPHGTSDVRPVSATRKDAE